MNETNPYAFITDSYFVGVGKDFTVKQKVTILDYNREKNLGIIKSDMSDLVLVRPQKNMKSVTPNPLEWQIDHITPKSKGGTNSYSNAQVLSRQENMTKSNK